MPYGVGTAGTGVRVLSVYPGAIDSEMNTAAMRQRLDGDGLAATAISADEAARQVLVAMRRWNEVTPGNMSEHILPYLARWMPFLIEARVRQLGSRLRAFADKENGFRSRNRLSTPD